MAMAYAPRTTEQRACSLTSASPKCAALSFSVAPVPAAFRRAGGLSSSSRGARLAPLAFRDQNYYGGRNFQRRGSCGPFTWQVGGPMMDETLEDLAREFARAPNMGQKSGFKGPWADMVNQASLPLDVEEQEGQYLITADVPGLLKSDLKITVNPKERSLTVSGERQRVERAGGFERQGDFRQRLERRMGKFRRQLPSLPEDADLAAVSARVTNGVLFVTIKKSQQQTANTVNIDID